MKRWLAWALALAMTLGLTACAPKKSDTVRNDLLFAMGNSGGWAVSFSSTPCFPT